MTRLVICQRSNKAWCNNMHDLYNKYGIVLLECLIVPFIMSCASVRPCNKAVQNLMARLESICIPYQEYHEAQASDVIDYLCTMAFKGGGNSSQGVRMILKTLEPSESLPRMTFCATNQSVASSLRELSRQTGLEIDYVDADDLVILHDHSMRTSTDPIIDITDYSYFAFQCLACISISAGDRPRPIEIQWDQISSNDRNSLSWLIKWQGEIMGRLEYIANADMLDKFWSNVHNLAPETNGSYISGEMPVVSAQSDDIGSLRILALAWDAAEREMICFVHSKGGQLKTLSIFVYYRNGARWYTRAEIPVF